MLPLLSLIGGGLGGALRIVPEIMKMAGAKGEREHEYKMSRLQLEIDTARSKQGIDMVHAQTEGAQATGEMAAYIEALKGQSQLTGVRWVDGLNATVRPFLTYWWMAIFTVYKATVIYDAWFISTDVKDFGQRIWAENDIAMLSMIISFWFVDRAIRKSK